MFLNKRLVKAELVFFFSLLYIHKMDKIKRFFHSTTPNKKLKKRLSSILLLKSSIVEPRIKDATLSKSTSFLQLQNANAIKRTIKKSRSMFGFDGNQTNNSSGITENTTSTLIINTSSTSVHHTNSSSSILHTAAVSISSAHSTTIQQQLLISKNSGKKPDYLVQLGIQYYEKGEFETAIHYWKLLTTLDQPSSSNRMIGLGIFFYGLALRHGWVTTDRSIEYQLLLILHIIGVSKKPCYCCKIFTKGSY
jgi:hypothetical protein